METQIIIKLLLITIYISLSCFITLVKKNNILKVIIINTALSVLSLTGYSDKWYLHLYFLLSLIVFINYFARLYYLNILNKNKNKNE